MKKNILILGLVLVILASMSLVCFGETTNLIFVGGQTGGTDQLHGAAIAEIVNRVYPEIIIDYRPGAGASNVISVSKGEAQLGFGHSVIAKAGTLGLEPYTEKTPGVMAIGATTVSKVQIVSPKKKGINSIKQIIDEKMPVKISVGNRGSTTELGMGRLLKAYGITYDDIKAWGGRVNFKQMAEANEMMSMGQLDIRFDSSACPTASIKELAVNFDLNLLPIDEEVLETLIEKYAYTKEYITNEDYDFVTTVSPTFGFLKVIMVREDVPEEIVYKITKAIGDNLDYFRDVDQAFNVVTQETLPRGTAIDLHPGAIRYYQEIGVMK